MGRPRRDPTKANAAAALPLDAPPPAGLPRFSEEPFAEAFRTARAATGKSLSAVAEATGNSRGYLSQVSREANGKRLTPRHIEEISAALGLPPQHFREWREPRIAPAELKQLVRDSRAVPVLEDLWTALHPTSSDVHTDPPDTRHRLRRDDAKGSFSPDAFSELLGDRRGKGCDHDRATQASAAGAPTDDLSARILEALAAIAQHREQSGPTHVCSAQCVDRLASEAQAALDEVEREPRR